MARSRNRRRRTLIRMDLQLKIVFVAILAACLVLLVNFQLTFAALWNTSATIADFDGVDEVVVHMRAVLLRKFVLTVGLGIPFAASLGILYSFKFCGPLYRIKRHLESLQKGSWRQTCTLRRGDDLQDVVQILNETTTSACEYADDVHDLLQETRAVLDELPPPTDDALGERISRIKEGIAREEAHYTTHFALSIEETEPGQVTSREEAVVS